MSKLTSREQCRGTARFFCHSGHPENSAGVRHAFSVTQDCRLQVDPIWVAWSLPDGKQGLRVPWGSFCGWKGEALELCAARSPSGDKQESVTSCMEEAFSSPRELQGVQNLIFKSVFRASCWKSYLKLTLFILIQDWPTILGKTNSPYPCSLHAIFANWESEMLLAVFLEMLYAIHCA